MHCNQALYGYQTNVLIESIDNRISTIRARVQSTFWNSEEGGGVVSRVIESVSIPADRLALIYLFILTRKNEKSTSNYSMPVHTAQTQNYFITQIKS